MQNSKKHPGITPDLKQSVLHVLCLRIITEATRKEVHTYQQAWLDNRKPIKEYEWSEKGEKIIITKPKDSWLMNNEEFKLYDNHNQVEAKKLGYELEPGECPLLVSENLLRQSERLMVEDAEYLMGGVKAEAIYRKSERWEKAHELIIGATVNFFGKEEFMQMAMDLANEKPK